MRGHPIKASVLSYEERGSLALEIHTGTEWKDITEESAIQSQCLNFDDEEDKAEDGEDRVSEPSSSRTCSPAFSASEEKKMIDAASDLSKLACPDNAGTNAWVLWEFVFLYASLKIIQTSLKILIFFVYVLHETHFLYSVTRVTLRDCVTVLD